MQLKAKTFNSPTSITAESCYISHYLTDAVLKYQFPFIRAKAVSTEFLYPLHKTRLTFNTQRITHARNLHLYHTIITSFSNCERLIKQKYESDTISTLTSEVQSCILGTKYNSILISISLSSGFEHHTGENLKWRKLNIEIIGLGSLKLKC